MHFFIDESGTFRPAPQAGPKASVSAALVVPSYARIDLLREYNKLRRRLRGTSGEMKGASLSENEARCLISMVRQYDVLLIPVVVNTSILTEMGVQAFRDNQADRVVANLTRDHPAFLVHYAVVSSMGMRLVSPQLFVQAFAMNNLVRLSLQIATYHYSKARPAELHDFSWVIDAKDISITRAETVWRDLLGPWLQSTSISNPMLLRNGGDYSAIEMEATTILQHVPHSPAQLEADLLPVIGRNLAFQSSATELGLQLADNLTSLIGRALNHTIAADAVSQLGSLMPRWEEQSVHMFVPRLADTDPSVSYVTDPHWQSILVPWYATSKHP